MLTRILGECGTSFKLAGGTIDNFTNVLSRALANAQGYFAGTGLPGADVVLMPSPQGVGVE